MIPQDIVCSSRYLENIGSIDSLTKIHRREVTVGCPPDERYWLHFDVKEGHRPAKYVGLQDHRAASWTASKFAMIGLDPTVHALEGFGNSVIQIVLDDQVSSAHLRSRIRSTEWLTVFGDFVEEVLCVFAGGKRVIT